MLISPLTRGGPNKAKHSSESWKGEERRRKGKGGGHPWRQTHHAKHCILKFGQEGETLPMLPVLPKNPGSVLLQRKCLKYTEASLYVDSEWNNNTNNIILKKQTKKNIAEWFALFDKESTVPAASFSSSGCPVALLGSGASEEGPAEPSAARPICAAGPESKNHICVGYHVTVFFSFQSFLYLINSLYFFIVILVVLH